MPSFRCTHKHTHSHTHTHTHTRTHTPGCKRFFQNRKCRLTHERRGDQCSGGLTRFRRSLTSTMRNTERRLLINQSIVEAHTDGLIMIRPQKKRLVLLAGQVTPSMSGSGEYKSFVTGILCVICKPVRGYLMKKAVVNEPLNDEQIKFLAWAWQIGEENRKTKLSSRMAVRLMKQHGLLAGQLLYVDLIMCAPLTSLRCISPHC